MRYVRDRMGVYHSFEEVPNRYRLDNFESEYRGENTYERFIEEECRPFTAEKTRRYTLRAKDAWCRFIKGRGTHPALAHPSDIEAFTESQLKKGREYSSVYHPYLLKLWQFYDWLLKHIQHPHMYQPVRMAILHYDETRRAWEKWHESGGHLRTEEVTL